MLADGRVRSRELAPQVEALKIQLLDFLQSYGPLLLTVNSLHRAEGFSRHLLEQRLKQRQKAAQNLIGRFATLKAAGLAINPMAMLDLAGSAAADGALVLQLCQLYELPLHSPQTKKLLQHIGQNSALVGACSGVYRVYWVCSNSCFCWPPQPVVGSALPLRHLLP
ncbi:YcjF family protein [Synechococcus lacustris Tous-12m]